MIYSIKLDDQGREKLCKDIGLPNCKINLAKGIIQVFKKNDIQAVASQYGIDNIDYVPYEEFVRAATSGKSKTIEKYQCQGVNTPVAETKRQITPQGETTDFHVENQQTAESTTSTTQKAQKPKVKISSKIEPGSIVLVKDKGKTMHLVITDIHEGKYNGARILLDSSNFAPNAQILLVKGKDVVYRNPTYKDKVIVLRKRVLDLRENNFIKIGNTRVVGKIINPDTMQQIWELVNVTPQIIAIQVSTREEQTQTEGEKSLTAEQVQDDQNCEGTTEEVTEEESSEVEFEKAISTSKSYAEVISNLKVKKGSLLESAIICATQAKQFSLKKLLPILQQSYPKNSQNALKIRMNQELQEWVEKNQVQMREATVVYFLKEIGRVVK